MTKIGCVGANYHPAHVTLICEVCWLPTPLAALASQESSWGTYCGRFAPNGVEALGAIPPV